MYKGTVQKSLGEGTRIGFPTANIAFDDQSVSGIYAALVQCEGSEYKAAVYADQRRKLLEAHLLDFDGNLYGKEIHISLLKKVRDDASFESEEALKAAIARDVAAVRTHFNL